jgi:hypothetical protein
VSGAADPTLLERARTAVSRGDWQGAYDLLAEADSGGLLGPAELPLLAEVAYAAGHLDVTIEVWERAYAEGVRAGDIVAAAGAAARVAMHLLFDTTLMAPVRGWVTRAERLLEGQAETPVHAWVAVVRGYERLLIFCVGASSGKRDPGRPPGDGANPPAPSLVGEAPRPCHPYGHVLRLPAGPARSRSWGVLRGRSSAEPALTA